MNEGVLMMHFNCLYSKVITLPPVYQLWIIIKQSESQQKFIFKDQIKYTGAYLGLRGFFQVQERFSHVISCPSSEALRLVIRYLSPVCFSISTHLKNQHTHTPRV